MSVVVGGCGWVWVGVGECGWVWVSYVQLCVALHNHSHTPPFTPTTTHSSASAVYTGFAIFIVGWIAQTAVLFGYPLTPDNIGSLVIVTVIFILMPWTTLVKGIDDLARAAANQQTGGLDAGEAFRCVWDVWCGCGGRMVVCMWGVWLGIGGVHGSRGVWVVGFEFY